MILSIGTASDTLQIIETHSGAQIIRLKEDGYESAQKINLSSHELQFLKTCLVILGGRQ